MTQQRTSVEIQAYSVDEAIRLALEQLALTRDEVDVEVLSDSGDDEDAEALVRVYAKGQASQPEQRRSRNGQEQQSHWLGERKPGQRPSQRGAPPQHPAVHRANSDDEQLAKTIVQELLAHMGIEAQVMAVDNPSSVPLEDEDPQTIFIDILGDDLGMLIGRRGDHIAQIQYLVNMLLNRKLETWTRVILDVEGYRTRREESLVGLAERVARQVARSKRAVDLEPMPPNERRIIHLTLRSHPDVATTSSGEGQQRYITVSPRN